MSTKSNTRVGTYSLQLPANYVEVNEDEMEYVDGGGGFIYFHTSKAVINAAVGIGASAAAAAALAAAGVTAGLSTVVLPALAGLIGAVASNGLLKESWYDFPVYIMDNTTYALLYAISGFDGKLTLDM